MFFIEREDKLSDRSFCDGFTRKIVGAFNSQKYRDIIDPHFLEYIAQPGAIRLFKTLSYSVEGDYTCEVSFDIKQEESYVVSDGYEANTAATGRTEYTTGNLKIDATTTLTEKKHVETNTRYSQCIKTYKVHHPFGGRKDDFRSCSASEYGSIDRDYRRNILVEIQDNEGSYGSPERYSKEEKEVKREYDEMTASNVQVSVKAKKVSVISPEIGEVDVYGEYHYFASIVYNGKEYTYSEYDDFEQDFPLNSGARRKARRSKGLYKAQRSLAWVMGVPTFVALAAILIVAIFVRFNGEQAYLTFITFPFTLIDIAVAIVYVILFISFIGTLNDIISCAAGGHMLHRKSNRNKTAVIEIFYYIVSIGSLALAIFQMICVVQAFQEAL